MCFADIFLYCSFTAHGGQDWEMDHWKLEQKVAVSLIIIGAVNRTPVFRKITHCFNH